MATRAVGRKVSVEVSLDGTTFVDVSNDNRTGFDVSILSSERPRHDGGGLMAHDLIDHAEGTFSFTLDSTSVTRPVFAAGGGRRMWVRYGPRGQATGFPHSTYQAFVGVTKNYEPQGAVTYAVTGTIEVEPVEGAF